MKKVMLLHPLLDLAERALRLPAFFKYGSVQQRFHTNQLPLFLLVWTMTLPSPTFPLRGSRDWGRIAFGRP